MKKYLKKFLIGFGVVFIVLFGVLVAHIATAKPVVIEKATRQITRFDFPTSIDKTYAEKIKEDLSSIEGVKDKILIKDKVVVFYHDNKITNNQKIYNSFLKKGHTNATLFTIPEELANKKVCPAIKQDGFAYHFSKGIQRIFN